MRALSSAVAMWQQRQRRGEELLRCPGRRSGAWPQWPGVSRGGKFPNHRACPLRQRPSGVASE
eukprot:1161168-Pelagomonas_calceolata.AAC.2